MHKIITAFFGVLAATIVLFLSVGAAEAAAVTWISGTGNNADNCTGPATPCLTFNGATGALAKTNASGVIHVLTGEYSAIVIDKSVQIIADGGQASNSSSTTGIGGVIASFVVNAGAADVVRIRGFVLNRNGANSGGGIALIAGAALYIENCTITGGPTNFGIQFKPTGASELYVTDSTIADNGDASVGGGILIEPTGSGSAKVVLDNVLVENNRVGILINGATSSGGIDMSMRDSTISGSTTIGIGVFEAVGGGGSPSKAQVARTTISSNGGQGIFASRSLATVRVRQSEITGNTVGVQTQNGGQIISHGDNLLADNTTNGAFTSTLPPQ